ncbi:hypothetical protein XELAEV_18031315mg [Xenopus laevis]|uniref:Uncharacterized protein n=1 Tax=Xenopus laevis TaxID=8355 RepID=A0A974HFX6_XENLA|nr:hypothetical protein XELAEV_18031315mg [Xenopus laevis]
MCSSCMPNTEPREHKITYLCVKFSACFMFKTPITQYKCNTNCMFNDPRMYQFRFSATFIFNSPRMYINIRRSKNVSATHI